MKATRLVCCVSALAALLFVAGCASETEAPSPPIAPAEAAESTDGTVTIGQTSSALQACPYWVGYPGLPEPNSGPAIQAECTSFCVNTCHLTAGVFTPLSACGVGCTGCYCN